MLYFRAFFINILASWALFRRDYRNAILRLESLRQLTEKRHGYGHIKTAPILYKLAFAYHHSYGADNFRFAILLYERALTIAEQWNEQKKDALVGQIAEAMGDWYAQVANYTMAEASYLKSIRAIERKYGPASIKLLNPIYSRAESLRRLCRIDEAQQLEQQAKWIEEAAILARASDYDFHRQHPHF